MTTTESKPTEDPTTDDVVEEIRTWLEDNWDPDLTVGQWWERLGLAGWSAPQLPTYAYGRGLARNDAVRVQNEIADFGALGAPGGIGLLLAAPTIAAHGTQEQIDLYVRGVVTGAKAWCQLFSEPAAGSDLAGLTSRAIKDGDEWIVNGQKVWTSGGQFADLGMLIARTDVDVPKHQGITWFAADMHDPGMDVRPLRELTGHAMFNEVFMTDVRIPDSAVIGGTNNGWAVTNTTLMNERAGLGAGGGSAAASMVTPGTIAAQLDRRVGDVAPGGGRRNKDGGRRDKDGGRRKKGGGGPAAMFGASAKMLIDMAKGNGTSQDPSIRQDLVRLHTMNEIGRFNGLRLKAAKAAGQDIPGMPNISKLSMSAMVGLQRDLGLRIVGPYGTLHCYDETKQAALNEATGNPFLPMVTTIALFAQAPPIYGGTDQIQRNILGERVLGLPKEPNQDRVLTFAELPKNG